MDRFVVPPHLDGARLVDVAREHLAVVPAREVGPLIARGGVLVDGEDGVIAEPVRAEQVLTLTTDAFEDLRTRGRVTTPSERPLVVLHEDADVVVVDKPAGIHVHPLGPYRDDTLLGSALWHAGARPDGPWAAWRPYPAHRLDRATSGLLAFAKSRSMQDGFRRLFDEGLVTRGYEAWVAGTVAGGEFSIDLPLGPDPTSPYRRATVALGDGGQHAVTHVTVLERGDGRTRVALTLGTGRTHQIRAHLAAIGHPVTGDTLYTGSGARGTSARSIDLRAVSLGFPHPRTGELLSVTAAS